MSSMINPLREQGQAYGHLAYGFGSFSVSEFISHGKKDIFFKDVLAIRYK